MNNKGADQTYGQAGLRLCCSRTPEDRFLVSRSICDLNIYKKKIYISFQCAIAVAMCAFIASMELEVRENGNIISVEWL